MAQIPVLRKKPRHVIYGPLEKFSNKPEVVLLFANAQQGLIISEAITREDKNIPFAMGRPSMRSDPTSCQSRSGGAEFGLLWCQSLLG